MYICVINGFSAKRDFRPFFLYFPLKTISIFLEKNVVVFVIDSIQFVTISFVYVKNHLDSLWSVCQLMV